MNLIKYIKSTLLFFTISSTAFVFNAHASNTGEQVFHPYSADYIAGKKTDKIGVTLSPNKQVVLSVAGCARCSTDRYLYSPVFSQDMGKPIYRKDVGSAEHTIVRYLVQYSDDLWIKIHQPYGLGQGVLGKTDRVNVLAGTQAKLKHLASGGPDTDKLEKDLVDMSNKALTAQNARYEARDKARTAKNKLPKANSSLAGFNSKFLTGAKQRAQREGWEETLIKAYAISSDWTILRNQLTGIKTGRYIAGVVVMKRKDGLCSYQHVHFHQQSNGAGYQKPTLHSIDSGQEKLDCSKV